MAQPVYSLRIYSNASLSPSAGIVGPIVPAGLVYIVRDVDAFENTGSTGTFLSVISPTLGNLLQFAGGPGTANQYHAWRGRQVYNEGEQVGVRSNAGSWSVTISGYQLTLP